MKSTTRIKICNAKEADFIPSRCSSQFMFSSSHDNNNMDWPYQYRSWMPTKSRMISRLTHSQEIRRIRVQFWIECLSVSITILGGMFVAATPLLLMLIFAIPDEKERDLFRILIFSSFLTAFLLIGIAGLLGNLYYYYDHRDKGFKFMIHCGSGPRDHYFGDSFFESPAQSSAAFTLRKQPSLQSSLSPSSSSLSSALSRHHPRLGHIVHL